MMNLFIIVSVLFIASVVSMDVLPVHSYTSEQVKDEFSAWTQKYNKVYDTLEERTQRLQIFADNKARAEQLNKLHFDATFGVTKFSDLTPEEFAAQYLTYKPSADVKRIKYTPVNVPADFQVPTSFDWRTDAPNGEKVVTPVKNQGQCGSCWAFSATESIESAWAIAGNSLVELAPQQIVDCDTGGQDQGCNGGEMSTAFEYVIKAGGMEPSSDYPYTAENGQCKFDKTDVVAKISDWKWVTQSKNETEMLYTMMKEGPISIAADATTWQFYVGGVITGACGDSLDHGIQITGFSQQGWVGTYDVWNVRNSWGADWGEEGYIWIERGSDICGLAEDVSIPIV